jgi:hypothetical protein
MRSSDRKTRSPKDRDLMNHTPAETRTSLILRLRDAEDVSAWNEFATIYGPVVYRVATHRRLCRLPVGKPLRDLPRGSLIGAESPGV